MNKKHPLLMIALLVCGAPWSSQAAEVRPGGALELTISGFARFLVAGGNLNEKFNLDADARDEDPLRNFDFRNDTEVHVSARGVHDATGIEYGGTVEFEADTNQNPNTDETWLFVRSGLGELRFGDTNSAADNMKIGAYSIAVGTGGLDGEVVDFDDTVRVDFIDVGNVLLPGPDGVLLDVRSDQDATRIIYYSPVLAGFQLGASYTPDSDSNGDELSLKKGVRSIDSNNRPRARIGFDDVFSGGLTYTNLFGDVGFRASVVGSRGEMVDLEDKTAWGVYAGAAVQAYGFALAGGLGREELDIAQQDRTFWNLGLSYTWRQYAFSVNYGRSNIDQPVLRNPDGPRVGPTGRDLGRILRARETRTDALVFGAEVGLLPGLVLSGELALFDREFQESLRNSDLPPGVLRDDEPTGNGNGWTVSDDDSRDARGAIGVIRLGLAF
jgi:outer membrane protein OmpU